MKLQYGPYSPSKLDTAECGYAFYKQYIDPERKKHPRVEGVAQARGSAVHEVFEKITHRFIAHVGKDHPVFSPEEIRTWTVEALNRHPAAFMETQDVLDMARRYIHKPPVALTSDAGVELRLAIMHDGKDWVECSYDSPDAVARGRADIMLISDDLTTGMFYDHKTQPNIEEADTNQMSFYAWVISKINPSLERIETVLHFARYGVYSEPYVWDKARLDQAEDVILTRIQAVESRTSWEATPNKNCQYCPYLAECPVMGRYITKDDQGNTYLDRNGFKILGNTSKAVEVAGAINVLEEALKIAKKELREHVKGSQYGIAIPGKVYEFRVEESINWDAVNKLLRDPAYGIFEKHGIDPRQWMGFSQTFTKDVWLLGNKELLDELSALFPRKRSTEFGGYKV